MKKACLIAFSLVLTSLPGLAQPQSAAPIDLASLFSPSPAGSCPQPKSAEGFGNPGLEAECTADCGMHGLFICQWTTSCSAVDRHCPRRGSVTCNGVTTLCPVCIEDDYCWQCQQDSSDCVSCCVCEGDTVYNCRQACP